MTTAAEVIAAVDAGDVAAVETFLAVDPSLASSRGADGVSALLHARYRFHREVLDALLAADPEMDVFDAAALGHIDRLRERLADDAGQATAQATDGFTALHLAAFFGKAEAARVLLDAGASPTAHGTNDFANQPLHAAAAGRHIEVCQVLIAAGADVHATQHGGYTPLHQVAASGDIELVELFLSAGADPSAVSDDGRTPAEVADGAGHADVARRLDEVGRERARR
ncbi:hypothetical protein BH20CHL7_BH20CHL7_06810 [soil metagenome]